MDSDISNLEFPYIYSIENIINHKFYIGWRRAKGCLPKNDLGVNYFSSSRDKTFKKDQLENPSHYKYHVLDVFGTVQEAIAFEIELHERYNVGLNQNFYNKSKSTATSFNTTGIVHSSESREKMRQSKIGEKNPNFGKPRSEETKRKIRESNIGIQAGEKHPFYGKKRPYISELLKDKKRPEVSKRLKNTIWINDGISIQKQIQKDSTIPEGFTRGMLKNDNNPARQAYSEKMKNSIWITNGKISKMVQKDQMIPVGFQQGRSISQISL
jgi:hypothetical protein